ncbi:MAG: hypothetical protein ACI8PZ_003681 [Myxococcota bacterium]|jgi:hypothetical protein
MLFALVLLAACGEPEPTSSRAGSAIAGKPMVAEDDGPTLGDIVEADAAIDNTPEAPSDTPFMDAAAAAALNADGGEHEVADPSKEARDKFNPISVPQDGSGEQNWDWPFEHKGRGVDLDGDGELEGGTTNRKVKFSELIDNEEESETQRRREMKK